MLKIVAAVARAIKEFLSSAAMGIVQILGELLRLPGQVLLGGSPRMRSASPTFEPTVDPHQLIAELLNGHASAPATAPAFDPVALVVRYAKLPQDQRLQFDLSKLGIGERVRLWAMKEADLAELSRSSRAKVEMFLRAPAMPAGSKTKSNELSMTTPADLQHRVRMLVESGESPFQKPLTP